MDKDIYFRIDKLLQEKKMSRRKLATLAGIRPTTLQSAFARRSKGLTLDYLQNIANVLSVSVDYLLAVEEDTADRDFQEARDWLELAQFVVEEYNEYGDYLIRNSDDGIVATYNQHDLVSLVNRTVKEGDGLKENFIIERLKRILEQK